MECHRKGWSALLFSELEFNISQESVPVVLGGISKHDYAKFLPPNSYINIEDFSNPKDLADYLRFLEKNVTEYNKYHRWRKDYVGKS